MNQPQMMYVPQMASIAERVNHPARLVQCIQMHNEEDFAPLVLGSLYDEVDEILVVEGAVKNRPNQTEDGHSTDKTREIIRDFMDNKDPDGKVKLISIRKPWKDLEEMKQTFLDMCFPGDWIIINDADEFYRPEDIRRLRVAIDRNPHACEFVPLFLHFYRDFGHIAVPAAEWQPQHQRVFKYTEGMRYASHPIVTDAAGRCTYFSPEYQPRRVMLNDFFIYHYGYARVGMDEVMKNKQAYYEKELAKHDGADAKFDQKVKDWTDGQEPMARFDGVHPEAVWTYPMFGVNENYVLGDEMGIAQGGGQKLPSWRDIEPYKRALAGEPYGNIWLCMTGQAQPAMQNFHNGMTI
jgi:hypothetical protein